MLFFLGELKREFACIEQLKSEFWCLVLTILISYLSDSLVLASCHFSLLFPWVKQSMTSRSRIIVLPKGLSSCFLLQCSLISMDIDTYNTHF